MNASSTSLTCLVSNLHLRDISLSGDQDVDIQIRAVEIQVLALQEATPTLCYINLYHDSGYSTVDSYGTGLHGTGYIL